MGTVTSCDADRDVVLLSDQAIREVRLWEDGERREEGAIVPQIAEAG